MTLNWPMRKTSTESTSSAPSMTWCVVVRFGVRAFLFWPISVNNTKLADAQDQHREHFFRSLYDVVRCGSFWCASIPVLTDTELVYAWDQHREHFILGLISMSSSLININQCTRLTEWALCSLSTTRCISLGLVDVYIRGLTPLASKRVCFPMVCKTLYIGLARTIHL